MLSLMPKKTAAPDSPAQLPFSPLNWGHTRPHVRPDEIARALGITGRQVADLIEADAFRGVPIGDDPAAKRQHRRILRSTVEAWFLEKYFVEHGEEYPCANSPEIAWWREQLRRRKSPSTS